MNIFFRKGFAAAFNGPRIPLFKSMGQNFLVDETVPERIADAAVIDASTGVLEVGPGVGALTRALSRRAGAVCAVELDRRLVPLLAQTLTGCDNVRVLSGES